MNSDPSFILLDQMPHHILRNGHTETGGRVHVRAYIHTYIHTDRQTDKKVKYS